MENSQNEELKLKDIQQVSLDILLDVHEFCKSADIKYSLAYGTLIGAKRHGGFVPWDDDIDIYMPRPDYDRFCRDYKSNNNILISPKDSYIAFTRVCDIKRTKCQDLLPWCNRTDTGIWIDVFPIDAVEDDQTAFSIKIDRLALLLQKQGKGRSAKCPIPLELPLVRKVRLMLRKLLFSHISISKVNKEIMSIANEITWGSTSHCSQLVCGGNRDKEFFRLDMFKTTVEVDFEGHNLWAANGWEEILYLNYGNYMRLPPIEERVPKQSNYLKFYWK